MKSFTSLYNMNLCHQIAKTRLSVELVACHGWLVMGLVVLLQIEQSPVLLEDGGIRWNNKRGWSVPRHIIDSIAYLFGFYCIAKVEGQEFQSSYYIVHSTGECNQGTL